MAKQDLLDVVELLNTLDVDWFGRPLDERGADAIRAAIPPFHPRNDGEGAGDGQGEGGGAGEREGEGEGEEGAGSGDGDGGTNGEGEGAGAGAGEGEGSAGASDDLETWKRNSRKHERDKKKALQERDELAARLKELEDANKSEQEKALAKAREEGEQAALSKYEETRRADKIETAVAKTALRGITVTDGDDERTLKFADPDDAQIWVDRALAKGDLEYDDIYADGKVKDDAIREFLSDLLKDKPHLQAKPDEGRSRTPQGGADAGRGAGGAKGLEAMSPDDHLKEIRKGR